MEHWPSDTNLFYIWEYKVNKVFPVLLTEHDAMKAFGMSGGIAPLIL